MPKITSVRIIKDGTEESYDNAMQATHQIAAEYSKGGRYYAVLKDHVLTIKFSDSFIKSLLNYLFDYCSERGQIYWSNKEISGQVTLMNHALQNISQRADKISEDKISQVARQATAAKLTPLKARWDEKLVLARFFLCKHGILPPHFLKQRELSLKPAIINDDPPQYSLPKHLKVKAAAEYEWDAFIEQQPFTAQLAILTGYIKEAETNFNTIFLEAKELYNQWVKALPETLRPENEYVNIFKAVAPGTLEIAPVRELAEKLSYLSAKAEIVARQIDSYEKMLLQVIKTEKIPEEKRAEVEGAVQMARKAHNHSLSLKEATAYLETFLQWLTLVPKDITIVPLDSNRQYTEYQAEALQGRNTYDYTANVEMQFDEHFWLTLWPRDYVTVCISHLNPETEQWLALPLYLSNNRNADRYKVRVKFEPNQKYRLDFSVITRIVEEGLLKNESVEENTLLIST